MADEELRQLAQRLESVLASAEDPNTRVRLAETYVRLGEAREAGLQWKTIARHRLRHFQIAQAVEALAQAAQLLPNDVPAREQLYQILLLTEQGEKAGEAGLALAELHKKSRAYDRAEEVLLRCLRLSGEKPEIRRALAEAQLGLGQGDKAKAHFRYLAENHPDERERKRFSGLADGIVASPPRSSEATIVLPRARASRAWFAPAIGAAAVLSGLVGLRGHWARADANARLKAAAADLDAGGIRGALETLRGGGGAEAGELARLAGQVEALAGRVRGVSERGTLEGAREAGPAGRADLETLRKAEDPAVRREASALLEEFERADRAREELRLKLRTAAAARDWPPALAALGELRARGAAAGPVGPAGLGGLDGIALEVEVETDPPGAELRLAGRVLGPSPQSVPFVLGGETRVEAALPGHEPAAADLATSTAPRVRLRLPRRIVARVPLGGPADAPPAATSEHLAFGSRGARVVLVSRKDRSAARTWRLGISEDVEGSPIPMGPLGSRLLVVLGNGQVRLLGPGDESAEAPGLAGGFSAAGGAVPLEGGGAALATVADGRDQVVALDASGSVLWRAEIEGGATRLSSADGGRLVLAVAGRTVTALLAAGGGARWKATLGAPAEGPAWPIGGQALVPTARDPVQALDLRSGGTPYTWPGGRGGRAGAPCDAGGRVAWGRPDGSVDLLEPATGRLTATVALGAGPVVGCCADGATLYVTTSGGVLAALAAVAGVGATPAAELRVLWTADLGAPATSPPSVADDAVWVGTEAGEAVAVAREGA